MRSFIEEHLAWRKVLGQKDQTLEICNRWLQGFSRWCFDLKLPLESLQAKDLRAFQDHLLWTPTPTGALRAANTVHQALHMVRIFLRWCLAEGHLRLDITQHCLLPKAKPRARSLLSRPQMEALFSAPDLGRPLGIRNLAILTVVCELGLYGPACRELNLEDFDVAGRQLLGYSLSPRLAENLHRYTLKARPALLTEPNETALFLSREGRRMIPELVALMLRRYEKVGPRTLHQSWLAHREALLARRLP